jgi:predicted membrane channel-forming protein YqfA (hemolysin III family)
MDNTLIALIFIVIITIGSLFGIFYKMKDGFGPLNLKVYGLTLVVCISSIIVLTEIQTDKLTAVFSILGAIAGYLFGLKKD